MQTVKSHNGCNYDAATKRKFEPEVAIAFEKNDLLHGDLLFKF